jgi:hypothetical protein
LEEAGSKELTTKNLNWIYEQAAWVLCFQV